MTITILIVHRFKDNVTIMPKCMTSYMVSCVNGIFFISTFQGLTSVFGTFLSTVSLLADLPVIGLTPIISATICASCSALGRSVRCHCSLILGGRWGLPTTSAPLEPDVNLVVELLSDKAVREGDTMRPNLSYKYWLFLGPFNTANGTRYKSPVTKTQMN